MAAMGCVLGGVIGFWTAVLGKLVFGLGLLQSLALWPMTGLVVLALILVLPRPAQRQPAGAEPALRAAPRGLTQGVRA